MVLANAQDTNSNVSLKVIQNTNDFECCLFDQTCLHCEL